MAAPLRHLFSCPTDAIEAVITALPDADDPLWDRFSARQNAFAVHRRTRSIAFSFTDLWRDGEPIVIEMNHAGEALRAAVATCGRLLLDQYDGGRIVRLMLTDLPAGASIPRHRDTGTLLEATHRCHIPIETSPDVTFTIDDAPYHLAAGEAYEVDNMRPHAVSNSGDRSRIHLICNILPPDALRGVPDTLGYTIG